MTSRSAIAKFTAPNAIPDTLAPHIDEKGDGEGLSIKLALLTEEKRNQLLDKIDLSGTAEWSPEQREQVRQLFIEFESLFALDSLDLGKTSLVKHIIWLDDYTPFKECYGHIPLHLYE